MILTTPQEYHEALARFDAMIAQDIDNNPHLHAPARALAEAIEEYEIRVEGAPFGPPTTLPDMIELQRQHRRLKQKELAALLEIPAGRLSQILSGKRRVTMDLAKKLHERLNISPEFILRTA